MGPHLGRRVRVPGTKQYVLHVVVRVGRVVLDVRLLAALVGGQELGPLLIIISICYCSLFRLLGRSFDLNIKYFYNLEPMNDLKRSKTNVIPHHNLVISKVVIAKLVSILHLKVKM